MGFCLDNLNEDRDRAFKIATDKGFYKQPISIESEIIMIITELSEAINALRCNRHTDLSGWTTPDFYYNEAYTDLFEMCCKDTFEDELADTLLRALSLSGALKIDLTLAESIARDRISMGAPTQPASVFFFALVQLLAQDLAVSDTPIILNRFIGYMMVWCLEEGIEIDMHVYLKKIYNEHRPYLNGKSF